MLLPVRRKGGWKTTSAIAEVERRRQGRVNVLRVLAQGIKLPSVRRERHAADAMRPQALESRDGLLVAFDESRVHATRVGAAQVPDFDGTIDECKMNRAQRVARARRPVLRSSPVGGARRGEKMARLRKVSDRRDAPGRRPLLAA